MQQLAGRVAVVTGAASVEERFWILTHPEWKDVLRRRLDALDAEGALPARHP
jgi:hypothetical protein